MLKLKMREAENEKWKSRENHADEAQERKRGWDGPVRPRRRRGRSRAAEAARSAGVDGRRSRRLPRPGASRGGRTKVRKRIDDFPLPTGEKREEMRTPPCAGTEPGLRVRPSLGGHLPAVSPP